MKVGYKTSEFYLSAAAMLVGILMASGIIAPDSQWSKILGMVSMLLSSLGYTAARGLAKASEAKAGAMVAAAEAVKSDPSKPPA